MNTASIIGRLGNTPELRFTNGGTAVATFRLAIPNPRDDKNPHWVPVKTFGKVAEAVADHLHKGDQAAITGSLESSEWELNGDRRFRLEIVAQRVDFLARKRGDTTDNATDDDDPDPN